MATTKNITMKQFNGTDYDTLYPKTIASQVDGVYGEEEVLTDDTKTLYGLRDTATPNDVFQKLAMPYGYYGFNITTVFSDGTPVPYVILNGLQDFSGNTVMTDENGRYTAAVSESKTVTVKISDYIGVTDAQITISAEVGVVFTPVTITLERDTSMHLIQKSKSMRVLTGIPVDMCIVGGGAGGTPTSPIDGAGVGGGGGYAKNILGVVLSSPDVSILVGSGGAAASAGGSTSITYDGITDTVDGAQGQTGNGNGGNGYAKGTDGTVRVFNDPNLPLPGGGGGGGVRYATGPYYGGADFGGRGTNGVNSPGGATSGTGPGGGGGGGGANSTLGAPGAAGGLYIRVNAPEVSA